MSVLIKGGPAVQGQRVRAFGAAPTSRLALATPKEDPEITRLRAERDEAVAQAAAREAEVAGLLAAIEQALEDGRAEGRAAAAREIEDSRDVSLARLSAGVTQACETLDAEMVALKRLAPLLAQRALDRILGDSARHAELLAPLLKTQLDQLQGETVISVEVSTTDFPDPVELMALACAIERPGLSIEASGHLPPGACRIQLRLGALEVGLDQQWGVLSQALLAMSGETVP